MAKITKEMTIAQVLQIDPGCAPIFLGFGMHCIGCPVSSGETLEEAGQVHGVDVDELVTKLNEYFADK